MRWTILLREVMREDGVVDELSCGGGGNEGCWWRVNVSRRLSNNLGR